MSLSLSHTQTFYVLNLLRYKSNKSLIFSALFLFFFVLYFGHLTFFTHIVYFYCNMPKAKAIAKQNKISIRDIKYLCNDLILQNHYTYVLVFSFVYSFFFLFVSFGFYILSVTYFFWHGVSFSGTHTTYLDNFVTLSVMLLCSMCLHRKCPLTFFYKYILVRH